MVSATNSPSLRSVGFIFTFSLCFRFLYFYLTKKHMFLIYHDGRDKYYGFSHRCASSQEFHIYGIPLTDLSIIVLLRE